MRNLHYYIQDYMGNNRMVVNRDGTIEQITHYYPYGPRSHRESIFMLSARRRGFSRGQVIGDISTNESLQKFKFEGKELDRTFGLDSYDIEARQYFAMAPMWDRIDPLAEKYYGISPYAYCGGDPVNKMDYDGMKPDSLEAALIANHVYTGSGELPDGWSLTNWTNYNNGLQVGTYQHTMDNGSIEYALAFSGTNMKDQNDVNTDILQAFGQYDTWEKLKESQFGIGLTVTNTLLQNNLGHELSIVGHSLGGAIAQLASLDTGIQAICFNAAGLNSRTIAAAGLESFPNGFDQIEHYYVSGEVVGMIDTSPRRGGVFHDPLHSQSSSPFTRHSIEEIIKIFRKNTL